MYLSNDDMSTLITIIESEQLGSVDNKIQISNKIIETIELENNNESHD